MPSSGAGEKTEQATPKRRRDERKKGNVFSSKDLVSAFFILAVFSVINAFGRQMLTALYNSMQYWVGLSGNPFALTDAALRAMLVEVLRTILVVAGPIMLVSILVNVLLTGAQTRFLFSTEALKPKFNRLSPISGIKRMFSLRSLVEVIKSLLKIAVICAIIYDNITGSLQKIARLYDVDIQSAVLYLCSTVYSTVLSIAVVFVLLGVADLLYQWWDYEKNLRMTKQEVKEEYKQLEGNPQIKSKIRQKQQEMARRRMMQEVPNADVVIRNPTHYAIAIRYEPEKNHAPQVVAKGADQVALKIIQIAEENKITLTENRPLARALYEEVDIGREIPPSFYQEVAEILAWVYDLKNKKISY